MQVKCTSCGASQNISQAQDCEFCGNNIELETAESNYQSYLKGESGNLMSMAETAIEATNWEEALQFYNQVLTKDISNYDAWLGKGIAIVYTSKIGDIKTTEAIAYWKNAIKHAPNTEAMEKRVAKEINKVVNGFYPSIENHYIQFHDLDNSYKELVSRFATLENAQDFASKLDDQNIAYFKTGYELCKRVVDLPKRYANAASSSALAEGIAGQFSSNEYSRKHAANKASDKIKKANNRKLEIENASKIIINLELKYINGIRKIDPASTIKPSGGKASETDEYAIDFVKKTFKEKNNSLASTELAFKKEFGIEMNNANKIVRKILLNEGLITEEEIKKSDKNAAIFGLIILAIVVVWIIFSYLR
jgi:hypothetical protein